MSATGKSKANKKKKAKSSKIKNVTTGWLSDVRYGKTVSVNFFRQNAWLMVLFISIVLALIGVKYKTRTKLAEIKNLEKELVVSQTDMLKEKASYMTLIRETEMLRLMNKNNLDLIFQEQPPYIIKLEND